MRSLNTTFLLVVCSLISVTRAQDVTCAVDDGPYCIPRAASYDCDPGYTCIVNDAAPADSKCCALSDIINSHNNNNNNVPPAPPLPRLPPCQDKINPWTGISDCYKDRAMCNDPLNFDLMTEQCPRTCNRCPGTYSPRPFVPIGQGARPFVAGPPFHIGQGVSPFQTGPISQFPHFPIGHGAFPGHSAFLPQPIVNYGCHDRSFCRILCPTPLQNCPRPCRIC